MASNQGDNSKNNPAPGASTSSSNEGGAAAAAGAAPSTSSGAGAPASGADGAAAAAAASPLDLDVAAAAAAAAAASGGLSSPGFLPSTSAAAAAAAAASLFGEDMDDNDMGRLQQMLEARGFPAHLAGVLGPRMHHLILNRAMAPSTSSKAQTLLQGLQATGDESRQLQAVIEMCQLLVMGNEDTLTGFPIRQVVPALIVLLKMEHNFDLMNNACRALTYMMEALPRSTSVIVDAIPTFLEKLQSIQCMDVAEQSLTALEMLSKKHSKSILHARGVSACLMFLDFFSLTAQRNALLITSNCCQGLLPEEFMHIQDSLSILSSRLVHDDKKCAETACTALSRLAESYKHDKARLRDLATKSDVLANLQKILITQPPSVSSSTFVTVLHVLVLMASHGSDVGPLLLEENIGATLRQLLVGTKSAVLSGASTSAAAASSSADNFDLVQRNPQELYEITSLVAELLPPLPADGIFAVDGLLTKPGAYIRDPVLWQWQDDRGNWHTYGYNDCRIIEAAFVAGEEEAMLMANGKSFNLNLKSMHEIREENGTAKPIQRKLTSQLTNEVESEEKKQKRMRHLELTSQLTKDLLHILLEVYSTSAGPGVRHSCIQAFLRMVYPATSQQLGQVLKVASVSSQIAGMLSSGDLKIIVGALQLSELLLQKMPDDFGVHFRREGVLHQVQKLTDPDNPICVSQYSESPLGGNLSWSGPSSALGAAAAAATGGASGSGGGHHGHSGRSWTVAGSSLANMFPDQLRVPKRRDESSSSPDAAQPRTHHSLSDMLKRKRVSKRSAAAAAAAAAAASSGSGGGSSSSSGRKGRGSTDHVDGAVAAATGASSSAGASSGLSMPTLSMGAASMAGAAGTSSSSSPFDMSYMPSAMSESLLGAAVSGGGGPSTPSRRSRLADRTSSLLSQLHPSRWVGGGSRSSAGASAAAGSSSSSSSASSMLDGRRDSHHQQKSSSADMHSSVMAISSPATLVNSREKAKRWVREQASRFLESYFKESLGSRHPALTILRRLSAQVDHLTRKPKDGERSLKEILSVLHENDISPFEMTQSGLVPSLLTYLTKPDDQMDDICRLTRVRTFLHVFLGCPSGRNMVDLEDAEAATADSETAQKFLHFVQKINACINHLEQFPIKMYDAGASGVKSAGSTLRFFKTHHLKCSLQRHPECTSLKSWKGGLVKIDPLALVQAIERYLISRGYGHPQDKESGGSDDDMSDEGADDDMLPSSSRSGADNGASSSVATASASSASTSTTSTSGGASALASTAASSSSAHRIEFSIGNNILPYDMTVYQAVQMYGSPMFDMSDSDSERMASSSSTAAAATSFYGSPGIWARIHTIYYRPVSERESGSDYATLSMTPTSSGTGAKSSSSSGKDLSSGKKGKSSKQSKRKAPDEVWVEGMPPETMNPLEAFLVDKLPKFKNLLQDPSLDHLCLLRILHAMNRYWGSLYPTTSIYYRPVLPPAEFVNPKLTAKVNRQLQDPIIIMTSNLPTWLKEVASACPFLFPFETRQLLFYVTSFDRDRALLRLLDSVPELAATEVGQERVTPDLDRKKRVISRENLLKQAEQVVNELAHSRSLLEIQYENEVGTGLGPTLEFYTLVSKEMQRGDLALWKGDTVKIGQDDVMDSDEEAEECVEYVHSATGLYPLPMARNVKSSQRNRIKAKFNFLGKFIAKAVLDNRMIDLPFGQPFFQWLLRQESTFSSRDLVNIDPTIANTVSQLEGIVRKKRRLDEDEKISASEKQLQLKDLTMDGCPIEDLGLDFTLPGYPNIELRKGGKDIGVTLDNLGQYVKLVSHWLLFEGVSCQMEALREGFESVFHLSSIQMFYPDELDQIFCGSTQANYVQWDAKAMLETCKPDHGFNADSPAIRMLFDVISTYDRDEQRQFLQFVTGCPHLPVGGFKALSPPLTIVKKTFDSPDVNPNDYLPSVMTCVNYLKLPDYSTKEIMREKLKVASQEGQYCFHLS